MTLIETICVVFSVVETAVTIYLWRRYKKKLDGEIKALRIATAEYESAVANLNAWKETL